MAARVSRSASVSPSPEPPNGQIRKPASAPRATAAAPDRIARRRLTVRRTALSPGGCTSGDRPCAQIVEPGTQVVSHGAPPRLESHPGLSWAATAARR
jgi:hypothetical protein